MASDEGNVGARFVLNGGTTHTNKASIACMIIWPNVLNAQVSHYFAGDMADLMEEHILRWAIERRANDPPGRQRPIRINSVKLSYHGM